MIAPQARGQNCDDSNDKKGDEENSSSNNPNSPIHCFQAFRFIVVRQRLFWNIFTVPSFFNRTLGLHLASRDKGRAKSEMTSVLWEMGDVLKQKWTGTRSKEILINSPYLVLRRSTIFRSRIQKNSLES